MGKPHHPRRGSMAYYPRKRAKRIYPRGKTVPSSDETGLAEFAGYKVGMLQVSMINDIKEASTANQEIIVPVTVLETPALKVCGIRYYAKDGIELKAAGEKWADSPDKNLERKIQDPANNGKKELKDIEQVEKIRLIVHTQPIKTGIGKKKPELFEITVRGKDLDEKIKFAEEKLGKEIRISDVFTNGQVVDISGVTKGKGFQGSVKRFGVKPLPCKTQKVIRKAGNLGPWHPHKTRYTVPQFGQMGFHTRTQYNLRVLKISEDAHEINKKEGWNNYGLVKSDYILIKGSVQGPRKRLVRMRAAIRSANKPGEPAINEMIL